MKYISKIKHECNKVYIYDESIKFEELNSDTDNFITIDLTNYNVSYVYSFFEKAVLSSILNNSFSNIEFDYSNIEKESFYSDETFKNLIEMFDQIIERANKTIDECNFILKKGV